MHPESWHSYPSIYALGRKAVESLTSVPVQVEEKVDGSQFSFCRTEDGEVLVRSKGCVMHVDAPEKMFTKAVESVKERVSLLHPGWTYRAEYLAKPKHNTLAYDRVPRGHLILFDVNRGHEDYLGWEDREVEAERIGLESVPVLFTGALDLDQLRSLLTTVSCLGGQPIEGVVVKPVGYDLFGPDKKCLMGKFVSEAFKEIHNHAWREQNPKSGDILDQLARTFTTEARWAKAVQHLQERGELESSPRDIGKLIPAISEDIKAECRDEIIDHIWQWAWPHLKRSVTHGAAGGTRNVSSSNSSYRRGPMLSECQQEVLSGWQQPYPDKQERFLTRTPTVLGVIPCRWKSSRFPGKALEMIGPYPMFYHVYQRVMESGVCDKIVVATEDSRIMEACDLHGVPYSVVEDKAPHTGTNRTAEVAEKMPHDVILNVQGDEPFISPSAIQRVASAVINRRATVANGCAITTDPSDLIDSTVPKVVMSPTGIAVYLSRSPIPYPKVRTMPYYVQVCVYAFTPESLRWFASHPLTPQEEAEGIELNRFIFGGIAVQMVTVDPSPVAVDTPADLTRARAYWEQHYA